MLTTLPLVITYFGYIPLFGLVTQLLLLPLLTLSFSICITVLVTIVSFPLLYIADILMTSTRLGAKWLASQPFAYLKISGSGYWFLIYIIGIIFTTRFIFMSKRSKYTLAALFIGIYIISIMLVNIPSLF